ncbi:MAG: VOC family protein [Candidatus Marinimicrobia bacterium]|nr:VOC family protein [Candidatus Neomarinimicrobiota bacterium]MCF7921471.1 VOC family protein [Candidatus Neomarinimicrobiota bacterium]
MKRTNNVVGWFEIYVSDMDRAVNFYKSVLDCSEFTDFSFGKEQLMGFPSVEDGLYSAGALVKADGWSPGKGGTLVYFNSTDCGVEERRVAENGGKVIQSKHAIGEFGFICIIEDTEGNMVGIHSRQ